MSAFLLRWREVCGIDPEVLQDSPPEVLAPEAPSVHQPQVLEGGLVKIDPLALVQAIEMRVAIFYSALSLIHGRYLVTRGYGRPDDKDSGSEDDDMSYTDEGGDRGGHSRVKRYSVVL